MTPAKPSFLVTPGLRLLLFGGKGGVGKTTCAAATALDLAKAAPEATFLLMSSDPAHSLADSLAGFAPPPNLQLCELDARQCLAAFKRQHGPQLQEIASRGTFLDQQDISRLLELSLPGLDELMASLEIPNRVAAGGFQTIVLDTAPSGHTLRLLAMPALLRQWLGALDALLAKHRYLQQLYAGASHADELKVFLDQLAASVEAMAALLADTGRSRFVPVMLAEEMSYQETRSLLQELRRARVPVSDIIVNQLYPKGDCPVCAGGSLQQARVLRKLLNSRSFSRHPLWGVPLYPNEVSGQGALESFWEGVARVTSPPVLPEITMPPVQPRVQAAATGPPAHKALLLFAGKGGVGKTTLACATSLRLAQDSPAQEVLLLSADPAHSLSACLGASVGQEPRRLCPGLTALEVNGQAEFLSLKQLYRQELQSFLQALSPDIDLTFDRITMERILDLSPPGLDEVMALLRVMDLREQGHYRTLVLDCAPTGHLIRLLEMPELIEQWLRTFFNLFLKYKRLFRLPKISQRLVEMSKALKRLRTLLADPALCSLYGVTILTGMAFEETKDLLAACQRLQVPVPVLFLNLATPPSDCPLCSSLRHRETEVEQRYERTFADTAQTLVYRQAEPRGLARLGELGQLLYKTQPERT